MVTVSERSDSTVALVLSLTDRQTDNRQIYAVVDNGAWTYYYNGNQVICVKQ